MTTTRVFVDACVFLEVFASPTNSPERLEPCKWVLRAAEKGAHELVVSTLVGAEVMGHGEISSITSSHAAADKRVSKVRSFFTSSQVRLVEVDSLLMQRAMDISAEHHVRGSDAIHIAAALRADCSTLYTYDRRMLDLNGQVGALAIVEPVVGDGQAELDVYPSATD